MGWEWRPAHRAEWEGLHVDISAPAGCSSLPTLHLSASCSLAPGTGTSAPNAFFLSLIQGSRSVAALQAPASQL